MTPASNSSATRGTRTTRAQPATAPPRAVNQRLPRSKVGWDRKFRAVMIVVFGLVGWIGLKAALAMYSADQQANQERAIVSRLQQQNEQLTDRRDALNQPATIVRDARSLGMVQSGERS